MHVRDPCRAPSIVAAPLGYLFELGGGNEKPQKALGMGAESGEGRLCLEDYYCEGGRVSLGVGVRHAYMLHVSGGLVILIPCKGHMPGPDEAWSLNTMITRPYCERSVPTSCRQVGRERWARTQVLGYGERGEGRSPRRVPPYRFLMGFIFCILSKCVCVVLILNLFVRHKMHIIISV